MREQEWPTSKEKIGEGGVWFKIMVDVGNLYVTEFFFTKETENEKIFKKFRILKMHFPSRRLLAIKN